MTKVMLVEDDNNLREIYEARLTAEGYTIVSAHDGEEALALAVKEKPDLIISDVMMPKISGFDMLDILRSTPETRNAKVIMMTALSQAEDRQRADKLGADRYLVKSQVTLEDVIKTAHEVLGDTPGAQPAAPAAPADPAAPAPAAPAEPAVVPTPTPTPTPAPDPTPPTEPTVPVVTPPAPADSQTPAADPAPAASEETANKHIEDFIASNPTLSNQATPEDAPQEEPATSTAPEVPSAGGISGSTADLEPTPSAPPATPVEEAPKSTPIPVTTPGDMVEPSAPPSSPQPATTPAETAPAPTAEPKPAVNITSPSHQKLVLQPTDANLSPSVDLDALLAKEEAQNTQDQAVETPTTSAVITPASDASSNDSVDSASSDKPADDPASQIAL